MDKKTILLFGLVFATLFSAKAFADTNVTSCQNISSSGTYVLQNDILNSSNMVCLNITASNVVLDCQNHLIQGQDTSLSKGVYTTGGYNNLVVKNCGLLNWFYGVRLDYTNNSLVTNCTAYDNNQGLRLSWSSYSNITGNIMHDNLLAGGLFSYGAFDRFSGNLIYNQTVDNGFSGMGLYFVSEHNDTVRNNTIRDTLEGLAIFVGNISYNTFEDNLIYHTYDFAGWGIDLDANPVLIPTSGVHDNIIQNNIVMNFGNIEGNGGGILLQNGAHDNIIRGNVISMSNATSNGLVISSVLGNSDNNLIYNNLFNSTNNFATDSIYVFLNSTEQSGARVYSDGIMIGGNYWATPSGTGFSETCADANGTGFCNTSYTPVTINGDCEGTATECSAFLNDTSCLVQIGCDWDYDSNVCYGFLPSGLARPCGGLGEYLCNGQSGCYWNSTPTYYISDYLPLSSHYVAPPTSNIIITVNVSQYVNPLTIVKDENTSVIQYSGSNRTINLTLNSSDIYSVNITGNQIYPFFGYFNATTDMTFTATPRSSMTSSGDLLTDVGSGIGAFLSAMTIGITQFIVYIAIIMGVLTIFYAIAYLVGNAMHKK